MSTIGSVQGYGKGTIHRRRGADTVGLSALVTEFTPHLNSLSNINHQANSKSRGNQELGTERSRQSHYIAWCNKQNVKDPVGSNTAYKELVGCYLQDVIRGVNFTNQQTVRSQTVKGYANAVNELFRLRNKPLPYILGDKLNYSHTAIANLADEETIAVQRSPLAYLKPFGNPDVSDISS